MRRELPDFALIPYIDRMDTAFRKIDIDIYDEDVLQESELYEPFPQDAAQALDEAKQRQSAVRSALAKCVREHFLR